MNFIKFRTIVGTGLSSLLLAASPLVSAQSTIMNVSYDVARELYKDINPAFAASWQAKGNPPVTINQSHGGSSKQVGAVIAGLEADVVTMNQVPDIQMLVKSGLVQADWQKRLPNDAAPYTSTMVFLVRKGNPKNIKDWPDLTQKGVEVIVPNPKVTGNGRYTYLAAWGYAIKTYKSEEKAKEFVRALFANVPVLDGGGRGATTTFTQRGVGDVLVTFENEGILIDKEVGGDKFDIVYPSLSIDAPAPVAVVDKVVDKRGSRKVATAYLEFLWSPEGQEIIVKHYLRPRNQALLKKNAKLFPPVNTFTVEKLLGGWDKVMKEQFADGGIYDQISVKR
ncbi:MAG: sulfate ABC transporter substrate-binding protein [Fluviibacter sp.]|jgi:sulfate transport system substrate-binding protein